MRRLCRPFFTVSLILINVIDGMHIIANYKAAMGRETNGNLNDKRKDQTKEKGIEADFYV